MKLRIRGNSLRLRLTKSEVAGIGEGSAVEETVDFGGETSRRLIYALVPSDEVQSPTAVFDGEQITVFVPKTQAVEWARTNKISIEAEKSLGENRTLRILIEKDFSRLEPRAGAEDADAFAHPLQSEQENQTRLKTFK